MEVVREVISSEIIVYITADNITAQGKAARFTGIMSYFVSHFCNFHNCDFYVDMTSLGL